MLLFRKKHFVLIVFFLVLSFSYCIINEKKANRSFDITQVSALPSSEKIIIIDAGHGRRRWWCSE